MNFTLIARNSESYAVLIIQTLFSEIIKSKDECSTNKIILYNREKKVVSIPTVTFFENSVTLSINRD